VTDDETRLIQWTPSEGRSDPSSGRGKRTRDAVLDAAATVFAREGVRQTSMLAIAQEAGVASGTVYQYFADKEDVFRRLLADLEDELRRATILAAGEAGRLDGKASVLRYRDFHRRHAAIYRAWWDLLEPRTEFTDVWLDFRARGLTQLRAAIADAASEHLEAAPHPEIASELIVMLFERVTYSRNILGWDEELTDEDIGEIVGALVGYGLVIS
jgi:AcrR family transcriptional regulator